MESIKNGKMIKFKLGHHNDFNKLAIGKQLIRE